jgi:hypothetical protein
MRTRGRAVGKWAPSVGLAGVIALVVSLGSAGAALADSASIAVAKADGGSDPVAYIARVFSIAGTASAGENLYVKHRPAGGAPCAPTAYSDPGRLSTGFYGPAVSGAFDVRRVWTWDAPGDWTFCMWLASSETTITTPIAQTISFRTPSGQIAASINPATPTTGQRAEVTIRGTSEAPRRIWTKIRSASGPPCAPTYDLDPGQSMIDGWDADGAFSAKRYTTQAIPGPYLVCSWLGGSSYDPWPVAGPQAMAFTVAAPPVVSSVATLNCRSRRPVTRLRAGKVKAVCLRYRFSRPPSAGAAVSVSYVTPARRTYKTVSSTWPQGRGHTLTSAALPARAYTHRRGNWRAILRVAGRQIKTSSFRVL